MIPPAGQVEEYSMTPSFINSWPLGEDLLEGRPHQSLAENIAELIAKGYTKNHLIGLDGPWGGGKSNVVKIIASELKDTHHCFTFDAWGHQEDLQRRAFLEELTEDLCNNKILPTETWEKKLKDLLAKRKETITKTIPKLSIAFIATILIAIMTPIAKSIGDGAEDQWVKIFITAIPALIGLAIWIGALLKARKFLGLAEMYFIYKEKDIEKEEHVTISESEPSVREFQSWMRQLSKALTGKKLIVVFDNMDRLPPDKVKELWASIHTFFAEQTLDGIWILIPFDRAHVIDVFENGEDTANQYLEKSFSVVFRVAPPVLTDWQKFFELKYQQAFGSSEEEDLHTIRRTFDLLQRNITPRNIIAFINEMVALRLVMEDNILLKYIALFVLLKMEILKDPVNQILNREFLQGTSMLFADDANLPDQIAALTYHVPLESASQVTLTRGIKQAIQAENTSRFNELAKHPHFIQILEQVIGDDDCDIARSSVCIDALDDKQIEGKESQLVILWDSLCSREIITTIENQQLSDTHQLLLRNSSPSKCNSLTEYIVHGIRTIEEFSGAKFYNTMSVLDGLLQQLDNGIELTSMIIEKTVTTVVFIDYVKESGMNYKKYGLRCDEETLQEYVSENIPNGMQKFIALSEIKKDFDFDPIVRKLEIQIEQGEDELTDENVGLFLGFYKAISPDNRSIKSLDNQKIADLLPQLETGTDAYFDLIAMRLVKGESFPNYGGSTQTVLDDTGAELVEGIATRIVYYGNVGGLLESYRTWQPPLLKAVLKYLILNKPHKRSRMSIGKVLPNFESLRSSLEIDGISFIKMLNGWSKYAKEDVTTANVYKVLPDAEFFEYAVQMDCDLAKHAVSTMSDYLKSLSVSDWAKLRDEGTLFYTTYWLIKKRISLPKNAITIYKEILVEVAKGEFSMTPDVGWDVYYERTNKNSLKATAKNIRDLFIDNENIDPDRFNHLSDLLLNHAELSKKSGDVVRRILAPVVDDQECLAFIVKNKKDFIPLVKDAGDDASDFKDRLRVKVTQPDCDEMVIEFEKEIADDTEVP